MKRIVRRTNRKRARGEHRARYRLPSLVFHSKIHLLRRRHLGLLPFPHKKRSLAVTRNQCDRRDLQKENDGKVKLPQLSTMPAALHRTPGGCPGVNYESLLPVWRATSASTSFADEAAPSVPTIPWYMASPVLCRFAPAFPFFPSSLKERETRPSLSTHPARW